jgi:riboflavin-specific deaminase-like protein
MLLPAPATTTVERVLDELGAPEGTERPRVLVNMIASADGKAAVGGRTAALGSAADRSLFHGLRGRVDAVLAGAGTVRAERYGPMVREAQGRRRRRERGLDDQPLACVVSASLELRPDLPLLADSSSRVVVITPSDAELAPCAATVDYVRANAGGRLDLPGALRELRARYGVRTVVCEGGPNLNSQLLADGVLDELLLSIAPRVAGGGESLTIVAGRPLERLAELKLRWLLEAEGFLFARYLVDPEGD